MKVLLTLSLLCLSLAGRSQEPVPIDPRLHEVYDQAYLDQLQAENPFLIQRLNYYLDHAYYLSEYPEDKGPMNFPVLQVDDPNAIHILLLEEEQGLRKDYERETTYSINGTRTILVLRSGREFTRMLNEELSRSHVKKGN